MKKLEGYKAFSYVAWVTIILFTLFTYNLVLNLEESLQNLDTVASEQTYIPKSLSEQG